MVALKLFAFALFLSLVLADIGVHADDSDVDGEVKVLRSDGPDSSFLEQLKSKIVNLESHIEETNREIKEKDEVIAAKEKTISDKSDNIVSLESEIAALQKKGKKDAAEQVGKAHARAGELEQQVDKLREHVDLKNKEKELLEARVAEAEKKVAEVHSKYESLQKMIDDQKKKLSKTERALQIAEEELMKAKHEATSRHNELREVHGAWLPPLLAVHMNDYQSLLEENWKVHGKPALERLMQKAVEKKGQVEKWAAPHVGTVKTKWIPAIKEQWVVIATNVEPHVQTLTTKTVELYLVSKDAVIPQIIKAHELADPYLQQLRESSKPYADQVATAARPHVDKLRSTLMPYTQQAIHVYGKFLESATVYHHQEELMKVKHEATSKHNELKEVHGAWLPPLLAVHMNDYQSLLEENWKVHGKPALERLMQKAVEKKGQVEKWAAPHVGTVKTKWIPAIKEQWVVIATNVEPHVQTLTTKTVELYLVSKDAVIPQIIKAHELADPYLQQLRESSKPYADQVATAARPHVDKLRSTLMPYTQQAIHVYGKFLESATVYHHQEELMKVKHEATSKHNELKEAHGAWLPPWLAVHMNDYQSLLEENWKVHGKPALERLMQKAVEKKGQVEKWAAPHVGTVKTKWIPAIKEQWVVIATNVEQHVQTLTTKTVELYLVSKDAVIPHIIKAHQLADPYLQQLRESSKPYIDQVATAARPHVDKLRSTLKPYTQQAIHVYGKVLESATVYHHQVQDRVHEELQSHELTKPLATKEFIWFSASAILALPFVFLLKISSAVFGTKKKKPVRSGNASHARRKGKRLHPDK